MQTVTLSFLVATTRFVMPSAGMNLVPDKLSVTPAYYTTWATQGYMPGAGADNLTVDWIFDHQGEAQEAALNSSYVFGEDGLLGSGWARDFYKASRKELYFLLDQGYGVADPSIDVRTDRFPEFDGLDSAGRLAHFQQKIQALGWRGLGLWNRVENSNDAAKYAQWCKSANITYWKIDGPDLDCACSSAAKAVFPELIIEHGFCPVSGCPMNNPDGSGIYDDDAAKKMMKPLGCSDVVRSYDTVPTLSIATTLSRLSTIMRVANTSLPEGSNTALLNGDAESYVTNALGCAIGPMRAPLSGLRPKVFEDGMSEAREVDLFFMGNRHAKHRIAEIDRVVRWTRLAPAFGLRAEGGTVVAVSEEVLFDTWAFEPGDTWDKHLWGKTFRQGAPASVSRGGLLLPKTVPVKQAGNASCAFRSHSSVITLSGNGMTATMNRDGPSPGGAVALCPGCEVATFLRNFSFEVTALHGEIFVGLAKPSVPLDGWVDENGAWAHGSKGIKGSSAGFEGYGEAWSQGDVIGVEMDPAVRTISFSRNGRLLGVAFKDVRVAGLVPAVWMAEASASISVSHSELPYVVSTRYPQGAIAITALGRTKPRPLGYHTPVANVSQQTGLGVSDGKADAGNLALPPIGIFGSYGSLTLGFKPGVLSKVSHVMAQDLLSDEASDVTSSLLVDESTETLEIPGKLIAAVGTSAQPKGDVSEPGLVLRVFLKDDVSRVLI
jgi:hypothetical protein